MEPLVGIEPTTYSLRMNCSTPELQRRLMTWTGRKQNFRCWASWKSGVMLIRRLGFRFEILHDRGGEPKDVVLGCLEGGLPAFFSQGLASHR